ncbi:hypothetical protein [Nocardia australiensis]|uniref:hypothetical protein n=1 Tax=Nocardia australiensis TaxID=2887191 RepID=UPI001D1383BF|nr:hypothetical protein [Nocardia australiensis]
MGEIGVSAGDLGLARSIFDPDGAAASVQGFDEGSPDDTAQEEILTQQQAGIWLEVARWQTDHRDSGTTRL